MALNSSTVTEEIDSLMQLQGRIQGVRDLKDEIPRGIFNIPSEVLDLSNFTKKELIRNPNLTDQCPVIQRWIQDELVWGYHIIEELNDQMKTPDWKGRIVIKFLVVPLKKFIKQKEPNIYKKRNSKT